MSAKRDQLLWLLHQEDYEKAAPLAERLSRQHPSNPELLCCHFLCMLQEGRYRDVLELYAERRSRLQGDLGRLLQVVANAQAALGLPNLALQTLRTFLATEPEPWPEPDRWQLRQLERSARKQLRHGPEEQLLAEQRVEELFLRHRDEEVIDQGTQALEAFPQSASLRAIVAQAYLNLDRVEEGITFCEKSNRIHPKSAYRHICLLIADGRIRSARQVCDRLRNFECQEADDLSWLLRSLSILNRNQEVLQTARRFRRLKRSQEATYAILSALLIRGQLDRARRVFSRLAPESIDPHEYHFLEKVLLSGKPDMGVFRGYMLLDLLPWEAMENLTRWFAKSQTDDLDGDSTTAREMRRWLKRYPRTRRLVPWMLRYADQPQKVFAFYVLIADDFQTRRLRRSAFRFVRSPRIPLPLTRNIVLLLLGRSRKVSPGVYCIRVGHERHAGVVDSFTWAAGFPFTGKMKALDFFKRVGPLLHQKRFAEAEMGLLQALEQSPDEPMLNYYLATCREAAGNLEKAHETVARCLQLDPTHPGARLRTARWLALEGKVEEAKALWREVCRLPHLWVGFQGDWYAARLAILARQNRQRAAAWLRTWKAAMPDHPLMSRCGYEESLTSMN